MSWLKEHKAKLDEKDAKEAEKAKLEQQIYDSWNNSAIEQLKSFVNKNLKELSGKKSKSGKEIKIEWNEEYKNQVKLMEGDEPLMELYFHMDEHEDCDSDGCKWGNGSYYINKKVCYCREFKTRDGCKYGGQDSGMMYFYEDTVAEYLLNFINI